MCPLLNLTVPLFVTLVLLFVLVLEVLVDSIHRRRIRANGKCILSSDHLMNITYEMFMYEQLYF